MNTDCQNVQQRPGNIHNAVNAHIPISQIQEVLNLLRKIKDATTKDPDDFLKKKVDDPNFEKDDAPKIPMK